LIRGGFASLSDADRRDHLGLRVFALGQQVASARGFPGTVLPQMEWLSQQTGEAVLMSVLDGDRQLYVHYVAGPQQVGVIGERGRHGPLPCTSMGKVLVAFAPTEQSVRLVRLVDTVELTRIGPNTITDREQFRAEIENVRTRGYAVADEEHETGIRAIGMPILDIGGRLRAAISAAAPAFRCSAEQLTELLPAMRSAADNIKILLPSS
jgi:IclR family acetate operon transcriptional repressor